MPGIITSSTTMSGGSSATAARQEGPSATPVTSNPSPSRKASSIPRMPSSSSQTRILGSRAAIPCGSSIGSRAPALNGVGRPGRRPGRAGPGGAGAQRYLLEEQRHDEGERQERDADQQDVVERVGEGLEDQGPRRTG